MSPSLDALPDLPPLLAGALHGDRRSLARALTRVENGDDTIREAMERMTSRRAREPGAPHVIGLSGPPGSGKSTLVDRLVTVSRAARQRVAVVAVDPSSPFTGGAILGDRVRMDDHSGDAGVFVRSLASRGHLGGLSLAAGAVVELLDLCGFDLVIVETVGVGQSEIAVMEVADTVLVVLTPESGDTVQTMKAGLMEIADVFIVNKADRPGSGFIARDLRAEVELEAQDRMAWRAPVLCVSALRDEGVPAVLEAAREHLAWCVGEGRGRWQERREAGRLRTCLDLVGETARARARALLETEERPSRDAVLAGTLTPRALARRLLDGPR